MPDHTENIPVIAQIGCGYWGPNLLRNLTVLAGCRVGLLVETSPTRREYVEKNFPGVRTAAAIEEALDNPAIDALVIATPARTHFDLARKALRAGKHIFVEKPLAMAVAEVDELGALAAARRRVVMVGHTFLYNSAVRYLKNLVQTGELGRIHYLYSQRLNLGILRSDINVMWNLAPHDVSIFCYLMDEKPVSVDARGTDFLQPGIEDVVFLDLEWRNRVCGHIHVSWLDPNKTRSITVVGSRKMVVYDDMAKDKIIIYDKGIDLVPDDKQGMPFDQPAQNRVIHRSGAVLIPPLDYPEPLRKEMEHFLECIATGNEPLTGIAHARAVVGILESAQKSLECRRMQQ